jgi:dTDP-4-dehydrorhamnose 3,5-epimerase
MGFLFKRTEIKDVVIIEPQVFKDDRGFFMETYKKSEFEKADISFNFKQDNHSLSVKNVLRGLHYQLPPFAQGKLLRCINGEIFDVAVDIRKDSETFGKWVGINLSSENKRMLYIPPGFAHGFLTLSNVAEIHYKMTEEYAPEYERGIIWNDKDISVLWPIDNIEEVIVSEKDRNNPALKNAELFQS